MVTLGKIDISKGLPNIIALAVGAVVGTLIVPPEWRIAAAGGGVIGTYFLLKLIDNRK